MNFFRNLFARHPLADPRPAGVPHVAGKKVLKAEVRRVGELIVRPDLSVEVGEGWLWDVSNGARVGPYIDDDGIARFFGYTDDELLQMSNRADEFNGA